MNEKEFSAMKPCMLYVSKSSSILDSKIDDIRDYLESRINLEADFKFFYGSEGIDENELINFFNTPPFFSSKKVAVIKEIDKLSRSQVRTVTSLLPEGRTEDFDAMLVMTSSKEKLDKDLLEKIRKAGVVKRLTTPHTDSLKKWLEEKSELDGIRFTRPATAKLIENVNFDLSLLKKEYEKLHTYIIDKKDKTIDEDAVDGLVSRVYEMKIFDLVDFIGNREKGRALEALKPVIIEKQKITGLVVLLFRMFKFMLYLKSAPPGISPDAGTDALYANLKQHEYAREYLASHLGHSPFMLGRIASNYTRFSKKYSAAEIIRVIGLLNSYDVLFRIGDVPEYNLMIKMINEIVEVKVN